MTLLISLTAIIFIAMGCPSFSFDRNKIEKYFDKNTEKYIDVVRGEIIVKFKEDASYRAIESLNILNRTKAVHKINSNVRVISKKSASVKDLIYDYSSNPLVEIAEPNIILRKMSTVPNDPHYSLQWALPQIKADLGWDINTGSANVIIAVVDSGIDKNHEDLIGNLWANTFESSGNNKTNAIDDDNNGYVDDYFGWNFAEAA